MTFKQVVSNITKQAKKKNPDMKMTEILAASSKIASYKTNKESKITKEEAMDLMKKLGITRLTGMKKKKTEMSLSS
jgi:hypothetical protein